MIFFSSSKGLHSELSNACVCKRTKTNLDLKFSNSLFDIHHHALHKKYIHKDRNKLVYTSTIILFNIFIFIYKKIIWCTHLSYTIQQNTHTHLYMCVNSFFFIVVVVITLFPFPIRFRRRVIIFRKKKK